MAKRIARSIMLGIIAVFIAVSPVFAIADPNTVPQINAVYVYNDLLEL